MRLKTLSAARQRRLSQPPSLTRLDRASLMRVWQTTGTNLTVFNTLKGEFRISNELLGLETGVDFFLSLLHL